MAACQSGKEPSVTKISLTDPPPRFHGIDPASLDGQGKWKIDKDEQSKYEQIFQVSAYVRLYSIAQNIIC